jgi:DnaJ-class molecular chaperone
MADSTIDEQAAPDPCTACRGSGSVVSNIGGTAHTVTCPWCDGGGLYLRGHDAQSRWREADDSKPA